MLALNEICEKHSEELDAIAKDAMARRWTQVGAGMAGLLVSASSVPVLGTVGAGAVAALLVAPANIKLTQQVEEWAKECEREELARRVAGRVRSVLGELVAAVQQRVGTGQTDEEMLSDVLVQLMRKLELQNEDTRRIIRVLERRGASRDERSRAFRRWNVPPLPTEHLPRAEFAALKGALVSYAPGSVALTSRHVRFAVKGMGGVGKSVLAAAVAWDADVQARFVNGVFWLTVGQGAGDVRSLQSDLLKALTGTDRTFTSIEEGKRALGDATADGVAALVIIDDVWNSEHARAFASVGGESRLLITTHKSDVATSMGAETWSLSELPPDEARRLLAAYAGIALDQLPKEAIDIARECGELPLALAMVGSQLRDRPIERWEVVLRGLRSAALDELAKELPDYPHPSVMAAMEVSLLDLDQELRDRYLDLAVFPEDAAIPEAALATYWAPQGARPRKVQKIADAFVDRALARRDEQGRLVLHDLQHDYLLAKLGASREGLHQRLVEAYRRVATNGLHSGPNDGYFFENIAGHVLKAQGPEKVRALLFSYDWIRAKLAATNTRSLLADFDLLLDGTEPRREPVRLLRDAIRLSAHALDKRPEELPSQLHGRLMGLRDFDLGTVRIEAVQRTLWPLWPSLASPGSPLLRTIGGGHDMSVSSIAMSGDGKRAISGSWDATVKVWDLDAGELLHTFDDHAEVVTSVALSADGKRAASASFDNTAKVWDLDAGELLRTHALAVRAVAVTDDATRAVSGFTDNTVNVWDLHSGELGHPLGNHAGPVSSVAVSAHGERAVSGSWDKTVKAWDLNTGKLLYSFDAHAGLVTSVAVSGDGTRAVSGSRDKTVKAWDLNTGKLLHSFDAHVGVVDSVALSGDGKRAISGADNSVKVWDLESGALRQTIGHTGPVDSVALSADGTRAVSASDDKTLKVWDLESGDLRLPSEAHALAVTSVAVSADGTRAVSGSWDKTLKLWALDSGKLLRTSEGHAKAVTAVALSADGTRVVSASWDGTLKVWDRDLREEPRILRGQAGPVFSVAVSGDGTRAVCASSFWTLQLWDLDSGSPLRTRDSSTGDATSVAVSGDGKRAVCAWDDRTVQVWDLESDELRALEGRAPSAKSVNMSADGERAICASRETVKVWDLNSGELLHSFDAHVGLLTSVALSGDGTHAVTASDDNTVRVWDLGNEKPVGTFTGDVAFTAVAWLGAAGGVLAGDSSGRLHKLALVGRRLTADVGPEKTS